MGYATVTGIATEPALLRAVAWRPDAVGLRRLRDELRAYLRAALAPCHAAGSEVAGGAVWLTGD